jgi:uncharacterized protein (DUF885 family)
MRILLLPLLLAACAAPAATSSPFRALCDDYWEWRMASSPEWATWRGDHRFNHRLSDIGASGRAADHDATSRFLARLRAIGRDAVDPVDRLSFDLLERQLNLALDEEKLKLWQLDIDALGGPQVSFLELTNVHPFRNEKDVEDFIARLRAFPNYMRQYLANLREGLAEKRVAPEAVVARVRKQLDELLARPAEKWPLMDALKKMQDARIPHADEYEFELRGTIKISVRNAFADFQRFLAEEYKGRDTPGIGALPGGLDLYRARVHHHTTTDLAPDAIHQIGLDELKSIGDEMAAIAKKLGHAGDVKSFLAKIKSDPANFRTTRDDLLALYRAALAKAEAKLPQWFGRLPSIRCKV